MSITEIILNFRQALLSVIPSFEKAGIPWQRPDAYDEWDLVASSLYKALVVEVLRCSVCNALSEESKFPEYDLIINNYSGLRLLEVQHPVLRSGLYIFHAFGTSIRPLDLVEVRQISEIGEPYDSQLVTCPIDGATFRLRD